MRSINFKPIVPIFDCLNAHLQKRKKLQTHHIWFLIQCGRLVNCGLGPGPQNHANA